MSFNIVYTFLFWIAWIGILLVILKIVPPGAELIIVVICAFSGVMLYFLIPYIVTEFMGNLQVKKHEKNSRKLETKKKFLNEQHLIKKYRYIKLNKKENIVSSNIDKKDKISLLEIVHKYTPEAALQLIEEYEARLG